MSTTAQTQPGIHPTATVSPTARVDDTAVIAEGAVLEHDVIVGPHCVVGPRTRLRTRAIIVEHTELGADNDVHPYAVLGGDPQDRAYSPDTPGKLLIGDRNIIREGFTANRGTGDEIPTVIGDDCYLMSGSHVAHNCRIGSGVILANAALLAGHVHVGDKTIVSGAVTVHQFCVIGEMSMLQGGAGVSMHVPPFVIAGGPNLVMGLNTIGLRRNGATAEDREQLKRVYRAIYRDRGGRPIASVIAELKGERWSQIPTRFLEFMDEALAMERPRNRGVLPGPRTTRRGGAAGDGASFHDSKYPW